MKLGMAAAALVLLAGGAVGCGDDGDDGDDSGSDTKTATTEEFCGAFQDFYDDLTSVTDDQTDLGKVLKDAAQKIEDTGTPEDIPDDAAEGLQLTLDAIADLPDDATADDISGLEDSFSEDDKEKSEAFSDYLDETCPDIGGGA